MIAAAGLGVRFLADRQRRQMTPAMASWRRGVTEVWGLRDVSLTVGPGEGVALVGPSGAGKSSLLRAIAGVHPADAGRIDVSGPVAPLLSTEAGLLAALTGRENAQLLGVLAGLSRREARARLDEVCAQSRLESDFERTVGGYSQGMRARLGFAAIAVPSARIFVLDEVHEAFDHAFRGVLEQRVTELLSAGGVLVAAGHDHGLLARLCSRAVHLEHGQVVRDGPFDDVVGSYLSSAR